MTDPILRPATADDVDAIGSLFHQGWHDVHPGHVPDGLTERRTPEAFHDRVAQRVAQTDETTVAEVDGTVAGFIMVSGDEAERQIAAGGYDVAWLVVVRGNERAQAFYAKQGWIDEGDFDYPVTALGERFISPCRRFTKRLR